MKHCLTTFTVTGIILFGTAIACAQVPVPSPTPGATRLAWDHDGANTDGYRIYEGTAVLIDNIPATDRQTAFPALTPGVHALVARAFNVAGESVDSNVLSVRLVVIPTSPGNFRVITVAVLIDGKWVPVLQTI